MRPAIQVMQRKDTMRMPSEVSNSTTVTPPKGIRISITIGDVNGIMESHLATVPFGSLMTLANENMAIISGMVMGKVNCCVSASTSAAEPMAAKTDAYRK